MGRIIIIAVILYLGYLGYTHLLKNPNVNSLPEAAQVIENEVREDIGSLPSIPRPDITEDDGTTEPEIDTQTQTQDLHDTCDYDHLYGVHIADIDRSATDHRVVVSYTDLPVPDDIAEGDVLLLLDPATDTVVNAACY